MGRQATGSALLSWAAWLSSWPGQMAREGALTLHGRGVAGCFLLCTQVITTTGMPWCLETGQLVLLTCFAPTESLVWLCLLVLLCQSRAGDWKSPAQQLVWGLLEKVSKVKHCTFRPWSSDHIPTVVMDWRGEKRRGDSPCLC